MTPRSSQKAIEFVQLEFRAGDLHFMGSDSQGDQPWLVLNCDSEEQLNGLVRAGTDGFRQELSACRGVRSFGARVQPSSARERYWAGVKVSAEREHARLHEGDLSRPPQGTAGFVRLSVVSGSRVRTFHPVPTARLYASGAGGCSCPVD